MIDSQQVEPNYLPFALSNRVAMFCIMYAKIDGVNSAHIGDDFVASVTTK